MGSLENRLARLEKRAGESLDDLVRREVLSRLETPVLKAYIGALRRARGRGGRFAEEDLPIVRQVQRFYEEGGEEP